MAESTAFCPVDPGMTARTKRNHQGQDRLPRHPMMHNHFPLASTDSIADPAATTVTFKNRLAQATEVFRILSLEAVAARAETVGKDLLSPARTVHHTLDQSRHALHHQPVFLFHHGQVHQPAVDLKTTHLRGER